MGTRAQRAGASLAASDNVLGNGRLDAMRRRGIETLDDAVGEDETVVTRASQSQLQSALMGIGGAIITAFMVIVVLSEVFALDIISQSTGPFGNLTSDFVNYGTAALGLAGIAIVIGAAGMAVSAFGGFGGMGGR